MTSHQHIGCENTTFLFKCFDTIEVIGCGCFGIAFKVRHKHDKHIYVVKMVQVPEGKAINDVTHEVRSLVGLNHQHIVGYIMSWTDYLPFTLEEVLATIPDDRTKLRENIHYFYKNTCHTNTRMFFIQMEFCEGITLHAWMQRHHNRTPEDIYDIYLQILRAVDYIHRRKLVHHDLKPDNIIIDPTGSVKIVDFGLAKRISNGYYDPNEMYCSFELTQGSGLDVYMLGVILYALLMPNTTHTKRAQELSGLREGYPSKYANYHFPNECQLIQRMMQKRISVDEVIQNLEFLWFRNMNNLDNKENMENLEF